jgi:hypothetical protein
LQIVFSNSATICNIGAPIGQPTVMTNSISIPMSHTTMFDNWVRIVQGAHLAGREVRVGLSDASGTCKAWFIEVR